MFRGRKEGLVRRPAACLAGTVLILFLLAASRMSPPAEPLAGQLRAAIWGDLQTNGMIGNGNAVAGLWMNFGYSDDAPALRMTRLVCRGDRATQHCRFNLLREGGVIQVDGRPVSDRIHCEAPIRRSGEPDREWAIPHRRPSPRGGHSRTTMRCAWDPPSQGAAIGEPAT